MRHAFLLLIAIWICVNIKLGFNLANIGMHYPVLWMDVSGRTRMMVFVVDWLLNVEFV